MAGVPSSPFPAAPPTSSHLASTSGDVRRGSLRDITSVAFGNPNSLPGPAPSHFFPSVPKVKRDQQRAARLASSTSSSVPQHHSREPYRPSGSDSPRTGGPIGSGNHTVSSPSATSNEDEAEFEQRQRQAKLELASHGPFPSSSSPFPPTNSHPSSLREDSSTSQTPTLKSVGAGGSHGTKRRHRETAERTSWDAASELMRIEREKEKVIDRWGMEGNNGGLPSTAREIAGEGTRRRERSGGEREEGRHAGVATMSRGDGQDEANYRTSVIGSVTESNVDSPQDVEMDDGDEEGDEDDLDLDDDAASVATFRTGASAKSKGKGKSSGDSGPAKKRSRTLTTPAQTAVLNALLAKTRFPSTETREEVGAQIGMSARRVQIWFQNRRQSQKRQRDRDAQDGATSTMPTNVSTHSLTLAHGVPVHPHYPYGPPTVDPYAAHRYPQHGSTAQQYQPRYAGAGSPFTTTVPGSHTSLHQLQHQQSRPDLSRQASIDSLASRNSFASAHSAAPPPVGLANGTRQGDGLAPLPSDARYAHPYASSSYPRQGHPANRSAMSPTTNEPLATSNQPQSSQMPSKLYFPHVARHGQVEHYGAPSSRVQVEPSSSRHGPSVGGGGGEVKLPSLSALLNGPTPQAQRSQEEQSKLHPSQRQPVPPPSTSQSTQPPYSAQSNAPSTAQTQPTFNRAIFSPPPSSSFERLRISGPMSPPPPQHEQIATTSSSPFAFHPPPLPTQQQQRTMPPVREASPDVLDAAMETMAYRPAGRSLPPRSTLPPLRSVFGESPFPTKPRGGAKTEADKALMAPILNPSSSSGSPGKGTSAGPPRLAPISTFPITLAPPSDSLSPTSRSGPTHPISSNAVNAPYLHSSTRTSTMSDTSTAQTRSSMASFDFGHHAPPGSHRDRYYPSSHNSNGGGGGWPPSVVGGASINGSGSSPRHRSSVGSSSRTSMSSDREK